MKKFKPFFICLLCAVLLSMTTACSCTTATATPFDAYWHTTAGSSFEDVTETLVYDVESFADDTYSDSNDTVDFSLSGKYTVVFKTNDSNPIEDSSYTSNVYSLKTTLSVTGSYTIDGVESEQFTDTVVTQTYFKNITNSLYPILSTREVSSHTLTTTNTLVHFSFTTRAEYLSSTCEVTYTANNEETLEYFEQLGIVDDENGKVHTISKTSSCYDNDQLLFLYRALDITDSYSYSFNFVDPTGLSTKYVILTCSEEPMAVQTNIVSGESYVAIDCYKTSLSITGTDFIGSAKTLYYSSNRTNSAQTEYDKYHNILVCMEDPVSDVGALRYTISSYVRS